MKNILTPLLITFLILAPAARAEEPAAGIGETREKLEGIEKRMGTAEDRIRRSEEREVSILGELDAIDRETARLKKKTKDISARIRELKKEISDSERNLKEIRRQKEKTAKRLALRSAALYKAGRLSYLRVILNSSGVEDIQRRSYYLRKVTENDSELFNISTELYKRESNQVAALKSAKAGLTSSLREQEENLSVLENKKREKDLILAVVRDKKEKNATLLKELESSAAHLKRLIDALELQAQTGESAFPTLKGSLKMPVSGKKIKSFGRNTTGRFNTYTLSSGVTIQSAEGTPVRSVYGGKVIFADWFSGYGRIIIVDHGGGYYTLYGHLLELKVAVGAEIEADMVIGLVGDSGSLEGPALYFEIRHHGKPVDPSGWFKG
ncbi:MAG: peptidoglycan DD-metalloendopeptidase family protein [Pseudomonadota bacterium]|jgi:septal ring factor EnvC (AmiA/AmiB activator)